MTDVVRAGPQHANVLAAVGAQTFRETFGALYRPADLQQFLATSRSPAAFATTLADPDYAVFLIGGSSEGSAPSHTDSPELGPAGYVLCGPCKLPIEPMPPRAGEVQQLYLRRAAQGSGLGSRLLAHALDWLQAQRRAPLFVGVWSQNFGAQRLYRRFGFEKVGEYDFPVGAQLDHEFILRRG